MADLPERNLRAQLDGEKNAGLARLGWVDLPGGSQIQFEVKWGQVRMFVGGIFRNANDQQLWIDHPQWKQRQRHLIRLCCTPKHGGDLHWHLYEGDEKMERTNPCDTDLTDLDLTDRSTLLCDVFAPAMKIVEFFYEGRLLP